MNLNGVEYYYVKNAQGDIIGLIDGTGKQVASYTYDSWGKLISIKDGSGKDVTNDTTNVGYKNPYRYRSYRYDNETQLYYLQSRYYNPDFGRFINADDTNILQITKGQSLGANLFAYCDNNPVMNTDPTGYLFISNARLWHMISVLFLACGLNPIGGTIIALGIRRIVLILSAKAAIYIARLTAEVGGFGAAVIVGILGTIVFGVSIWPVIEALAVGKGLYIGFKKSKWGWYYGVDFYASFPQ